jgi:hypothetical protein
LEVASSRPVVGPHGGPVAPIPSDRGFAEVVFEPAKPGASTQRQHVAVYFFRPDLTTGLEPLPSKVQVDLRPREKGDPIRVSLQPDPDPRFVHSECRFSSEQRALPIDQWTGELRFALDNADVALPLVLNQA